MVLVVRAGWTARVDASDKTSGDGVKAGREVDVLQATRLVRRVSACESVIFRQ